MVGPQACLPVSLLWEKVFLHASVMEVVGHDTLTSPDSKNSHW